MIFTTEVISKPRERRIQVKLPPPCVWCGEIEVLTPEGVYKITHRYELHPDFNTLPPEKT